MILSANDFENFTSAVSDISGCDPFACRIISLHNSYQPRLAFVDYWTITGENGEICGAIARNGSNFILLTKFDMKEEDGIKLIQPDIRSAYELIVRCADANFVPPPFEDFYVDVNHKLRHNSMRLCGIEENNRLAAVAMTVAESCDGAVLGAVSCDPDFRRRGYGSSIVKHITNMLVEENKCVFLHRAKNANVSFYNNLGFKEAGKWREYYFEG